MCRVISRKFTSPASIGALLCSAVVLAHAAAQDTSAPQADAADESEAALTPILTEIVVTARRRTESLIEVPVAVSAVSAAELQRNNASDLSRIAELVPQVIIQPAASGSGGIFSIRGVGSSFLDAGIEQTVAINIDGVQVGRGRIATASQFDLQQVEILKGPQALFFGKNSPAGVISIMTAAPTPDFESYVRVGYEVEAKEKLIEAAVSGPITDTLSLRVAARLDEMDGWIKNVAMTGPNPFAPGFPLEGPSFSETPQRDNAAGRVSFRWTPSDVFSADLRFTATRAKGSGEDSQEEPFCISGAQLSVLNILTGDRYFDPASDCRLNKRVSIGRLPSGLAANLPGARGGFSTNRIETYLGSLTLNYELADLAFTSVTGYSKLDTSGSGLYDLTSFGTIMAVTPETARHWSQELRVSSDFAGALNFTAGVYVEDGERTNPVATMLAFAGPDLTTGNYHTFHVRYLNETDTVSGFGQLRWNPIEQLELAGGVRYTRDRKSIEGENLYLHYLLGPAFGLAPVGEQVRRKYRESDWSPEATIAYHPSADSTLYAAYKTGYKSGGFSNPATLGAIYLSNSELLEFGSESAEGFEVGAKGYLLDGTLRAEIVAYRYEFDGLQLSIYDAMNVSYFIKNAGTARTTGLEGSLRWQATRDLTLAVSTAYNRAKYLSFRNAPCWAGQTGAQGCVGGGAGGETSAFGFQDRSGERLPRAPKFTLSAGFDWSSPISDRLELGFGADASYTSDYAVHDNGDPRIEQEGYWRLNASIRIADLGGAWDVAVVGRNLLDEYVLIAANDKTFGLPGEYGGYTMRPREILLQSTFRF